MNPSRFPAFLAAALFAIPSFAALTLVENGKSPFRIVISKTASPSVRWAAAELRNDIRKISGADLPVITDDAPCPTHAILLGKSRAWTGLGAAVDWKRLGDEGFTIKTLPNKLLIAGSDLRGAMYGAFEILERLGVRWYTPRVTRLPKQSTLRLPSLDLTQTPDFAYRWPFFSEMNEHPAWCAHTRTNGPHGIPPKYGGSNPNWNGAENFYQIVPPARYFKTHPEYFSLKHGRRSAARGSQLCLTNPHVLELAKQYAIRYFKARPHATTVGISPNDAGDGNCECPNCLAMDKKFGGPSGTQIWFVNQIADAVKKAFPHRKLYVMTLAYQYTEPAPTHIEPRDNVLVTLCPIHCCEAHPYDLCPRPENRVFMKHLHNWAKVARGRLYIWHYNTNFAHYLLPMPDYDELAADIPLYHRLGVVGFFGEGDYAHGGGGAGADMRSWIMAKYLWNVHQNMDALVREWCRGVYGKAWKPMYAYYNLMQRQVRFPPRGKGFHVHIYDSPRARYLAPEVAAQAQALFDRARRLAGTDATARYYIDKTALWVQYVRLARTVLPQYAIQGASFGPPPGSAPPSLPDADRFLAELHRFGITSIHEGRGLDWDRRFIQSRARAARPYPLVLLDNGDFHVAVAPSLGGRILQLRDLRTGISLLRLPHRFDAGYPNSAGYEEYSEHGYRSPGWNENYRVIAKSPLAVTLTAKLRNGLQITRRLSLPARGRSLTIATTLKNIRNHPRTCALRTHPEFTPGRITNCRVACTFAAGKARKVDLARAATQGEEYFQAGAHGLGGLFWIENRAQAFRLTDQFPPAEVATCYANWDRNQHRVNLEIWTHGRTLTPGVSWTFAHTITFEPLRK